MIGPLVPPLTVGLLDSARACGDPTAIALAAPGELPTKTPDAVLIPDVGAVPTLNVRPVTNPHLTTDGD